MGRKHECSSYQSVPGRECVFESVFKSKMSYEKEQEPGAIGRTYPSSSDRAVDQGIPERGKQQNLWVFSFSCRGEVNRGFWVSESSSAPFTLISKVLGMQPVRRPVRADERSSPEAASKASVGP